MTLAQFVVSAFMVWANSSGVLAIDSKSVKILWNTTAGNAADRYAITHAPLIVKTISHLFQQRQCLQRDVFNLL